MFPTRLQALQAVANHTMVGGASGSTQFHIKTKVSHDVEVRALHSSEASVGVVVTPRLHTAGSRRRRAVTRQQLHGKQVTRVAFDNQSETALCSAVLAQSGTDTMVSGQYLGTSGWTPVRVHWVPRSTQKKKPRKVLRKETIADRILKVACTLNLFTRKSKSYAPLEKRVTGRAQVL